ncbi:MAG: ABC transporter permease [Nitrospirae bacterium]|nr:ABC transporter permease [Nitrospirota bacterium]
MKNNHITIYEPNHIMKAGIRIWPLMFRELIESRELIWRLILRDISAKYKQSFLGILWSFLTPLAMMFAFVWIKGMNILPIKNTYMPYPAFVFFGQMVWLLFQHGITTTTNSLAEAGSLLTKINFPREVLVLSKLGQTIFEFLLRIPLLVIIFIWVGFIPNVSILLIPVALLPLLLLVAGLGFFLSLLNAVMRDISSVIGIILSIGMFATPVVYPPPVSWPMSFWINYVNPVSAFLNTSRDLATVGHITDPASYVTSIIFSILIFMVGWRSFHLVEPKIAEQA